MATKKTTSKSKISPKKRVSEADIQSKAHDIYQSRLKDGTPRRCPF